MKRTNKIIFVGDLQVYAESYASLYYSGSTKTYFISVRLSSIDNPEKKYATAIISPKQIVDYLNDKIGLRTILSEGIYTSDSPKPNVKIIKKAGLKQEDISKLLTKEDKFDPDYCLDMSDILYFIWKHNQINFDAFSLSKSRILSRVSFSNI